MVSHEIVSQRLRLEITREAHADIVFEHLSEERLWQHFPELRPKSVTELRKLYRMWQTANEEPGRAEHIENWIGFLRDTTTPVGSMQAQILPDQTALLAYIMYSGYQKHGYASEAAEAMLTHLHAEHEVNRVRLVIDTHNIPAIEFAKSLGFKLIEERRGVDRQYGLFGDESIYERTIPT